MAARLTAHYPQVVLKLGGSGAWWCADGRPTRESLRKTLQRIATVAGHRGRIYGAYVEVPGKYPSMEQYADGRETRNGDPKREAYSIAGHSCLHFVISVAEAGGVDAP